jgi:hypothetical protein
MSLSSAQLSTTNAIFVPVSNAEDFKKIEKRFFDIGAGHRTSSPFEFNKTHLEFDNFTGLICFRSGALLAINTDNCPYSFSRTLHCDLDSILTSSLSSFKKRIEESIRAGRNLAKAKEIAKKILGLKKEQLNDDLMEALTFIDKTITVT